MTANAFPEPLAPAEAAARLSPFEAFLAAPRNAVLCIGRGEQEPPHATPVWFDYGEGRFRVSITRLRVKYRLLSANPLVTLVVDESPGYRTVIVEGIASISDDGAALVALRRALWSKYGASVEAASRDDATMLAELRAEERVVVTIAPTRVLSWQGD